MSSQPSNSKSVQDSEPSQKGKVNKRLILLRYLPRIRRVRKLTRVQLRGCTNYASTERLAISKTDSRCIYNPFTGPHQGRSERPRIYAFIAREQSTTRDRMNNGSPLIAQDSPTLPFESIMYDLYLCASKRKRCGQCPGDGAGWKTKRQRKREGERGQLREERGEKG